VRLALFCSELQSVSAAIATHREIKRDGLLPINGMNRSTAAREQPTVLWGDGDACARRGACELNPHRNRLTWSDIHTWVFAALIRAQLMPSTSRGNGHKDIQDLTPDFW
jgi:hypothetical protein